MLTAVLCADEQNEIVRILDSLFAKEQQAKEAAEAMLEKIDMMKIHPRPCLLWRTGLQRPHQRIYSGTAESGNLLKLAVVHYVNCNFGT